jgi:hypothetical protein
MIGQRRDDSTVKLDTPRDMYDDLTKEMKRMTEREVGERHD